MVTTSTELTLAARQSEAEAPSVTPEKTTSIRAQLRELVLYTTSVALLLAYLAFVGYMAPHSRCVKASWQFAGQVQHVPSTSPGFKMPESSAIRGIPRSLDAARSYSVSEVVSTVGNEAKRFPGTS